MARRFTRGRAGRPRSTFWLRTDLGSGGAFWKSLGAATAVIDQSLAGVGSDLTIVRTRGMLGVKSDQVAATEEPFGAYGVAIVSEQALAIGATAVPLPYTDADSDQWLVHGYFMADVTAGDATGFTPLATRTDFDSKAMRKIVPGESVVFMLENGSSADGMVYTYNFAMLFKTSA